MSCRDLARHAQLWLNRGTWEGEQLLSEEFVKTGSTQVFPNAGGDPYGYGVRLFPNDPVTPGMAYFGGVNIQCAFFTELYDALVITMGELHTALCSHSLIHSWVRLCALDNVAYPLAQPKLCSDMCFTRF